MNLARLLTRNARLFADRPAVSEGEAVRLTYAALARNSAALAAAMIGLSFGFAAFYQRVSAGLARSTAAG